MSVELSNFPGSRSSPAGEEPAWRIDSHAHVFRRDLPMTGDRRYTPDYDALPTDYLASLDARNITHAVLVQPSFLGTDNRFLTDCLVRAPDRLRGIAVVSPAADMAELRRLDRAGVVGIRLNMIGRTPGILDDPRWAGLIARVASLGWQIEIHADSPNLPAILSILGERPPIIVIDHFCRPRVGVDCPGTRAVLRAARSGRIWIKMSAPYRCGAVDWKAVVWPLARKLVAELGPERLVWGSDWPWTRHETGMSYDAALGWLSEWVPDDGARRRILGITAARLFRFSPETG